MPDELTPRVRRAGAPPPSPVTRLGRSPGTAATASTQRPGTAPTPRWPAPTLRRPIPPGPPPRPGRLPTASRGRRHDRLPGSVVIRPRQVTGYPARRPTQSCGSARVVISRAESQRGTNPAGHPASLAPTGENHVHIPLRPRTSPATPRSRAAARNRKRRGKGCAKILPALLSHAVQLCMHCQQRPAGFWVSRTGGKTVRRPWCLSCCEELDRDRCDVIPFAS